MKIVSMLILLAILLSGCSKEEMNKMVADAKKSAGELKSNAGEALDKAKSSASDAVAKAQQLAQNAGQSLGGSGSGSIKLDTTTEFSSSYIRLVPLEGGSAVLQIKNNRDGSPESFPSFLIQGEVQASSLDQLVGKPVACRVFVQKNGQAEIWSNLDSELIMVLVSRDKNAFTAKFTEGKLVSSTTDSTIAASGAFECAEF